MSQAQGSRTKDLTLGALGGPHTFNAQAAKVMRERYSQFSEIVYLPTSDEVVQAALRGEVDAACAPEQTSRNGFHAGMLARMVDPDSRLYVIAEIARRYGCSLLGKPGAGVAQIRQVFGHDGSISHSRSWLEKNVPTATIEVVDTHSEVAARTVLDGDGSIASVGSSDLAATYGLVELARDIDDGSAVNYWALSLQPVFPEAPTYVLVTGRFANDTCLSELIYWLADAGYLLRTACPKATGRALGEYDYMLRFCGIGRLDAVRAALSRVGRARLAGAWQSRE